MEKGGGEKKTDRGTALLKFQSKTPMPRRRPVLRTQPNSKCSASNTGAEQVLRVRFFSLRTRAVSWAHTDHDSSPIRSVWRIHVPRLWSCSINGCKFPVK